MDALHDQRYQKRGHIIPLCVQFGPGGMTCVAQLRTIHAIPMFHTMLDLECPLSVAMTTTTSGSATSTKASKSTWDPSSDIGDVSRALTLLRQFAGVAGASVGAGASDGTVLVLVLVPIVVLVLLLQVFDGEGAGRR